MRTSRRRTGFTLVEILVVVSIIAVLVSLVAAGIFQVAEGQRSANTETAMRMVNKVLARHWKAVLEKADKDQIPDAILQLAANDTRRARVIWKKLRLKQEFPMTFKEAMYPYLDYAGNYVFVNPPINTIPLLTQDTLPSLYFKAILPAGPYPPFTPGSEPPPPSLNSPDQPFAESTTCLLLALKMNRAGISLSPDELGSHARDVNGDGLKELVDGWGNPMAFFRFPTGQPNDFGVGSELDKANPATKGSATASFRDPVDPEGLLMTRPWQQFLNTSTGKLQLTLPAICFERLCHTIHQVDSGGNSQPWSSYTISVLASSARNGKWGLNSVFTMPPGTVFNPDLTADPTTGSDGDDNIYSFRLKGD